MFKQSTYVQHKFIEKYIISLLKYKIAEIRDHLIKRGGSEKPYE